MEKKEKPFELNDILDKTADYQNTDATAHRRADLQVHGELSHGRYSVGAILLQARLFLGRSCLLRRPAPALALALLNLCDRSR